MARKTFTVTNLQLQKLGGVTHTTVILALGRQRPKDHSILRLTWSNSRLQSNQAYIKRLFLKIRITAWGRRDDP